MLARQVPQRQILFRTIGRVFTGLSDTAKAFLIILTTGEPGWQAGQGAGGGGPAMRRGQRCRQQRQMCSCAASEAARNRAAAAYKLAEAGTGWHLLASLPAPPGLIPPSL